VLEGVEAPELPHLLGEALPLAVEDANQACARAEAGARARGGRTP
jgi:hypothetical protein